MKLKLPPCLISVRTLVLTATVIAPLCLHAQYSPIAATGFNADIIVGGSETVNPNAATTQTIDGNNHNDTLYALGWNTGQPATGLPSSLTTTDGTLFNIQPYNAMNAVYNGGALTLTTPEALTSLAILGLSGNSSDATSLTITVNYAGGGTQTFGSLNCVQDWFNNSNLGASYSTGGRVNVDNHNLDNVGGTDPLLHDSILTLSDTIDAVDSITINNNGNTSTAILAISGIQAVPEPTTLGLLGFGIGAVTLFARRRSVA